MHHELLDHDLLQIFLKGLRKEERKKNDYLKQIQKKKKKKESIPCHSSFKPLPCFLFGGVMTSNWSIQPWFSIEKIWYSEINDYDFKKKKKKKYLFLFGVLWNVKLKNDLSQRKVYYISLER